MGGHEAKVVKTGSLQSRRREDECTALISPRDKSGIYGAWARTSTLWDAVTADAFTSSGGTERLSGAEVPRALMLRGCPQRRAVRNDQQGAGPLSFAKLSLRRGGRDTSSQAGAGGWVAWPTRCPPPPPPRSSLEKTPITLIGSSGEEMEKPGGRGQSLQSQSSRLTAGRCQPIEFSPALIQQTLNLHIFAPFIITLDAAAVYRWYRAGRCDVADKIPDWLCLVMRHFSLFIPIIFSRTVFSSFFGGAAGGGGGGGGGLLCQ